VPKKEVHAGFRAEAPLDARVGEVIANTMQALSTPSRVHLLYALRDGELSVGELAEGAQVTPAAASQQLRILRHLNLVVARREGQTMLYRLHDEHVGALLDEIRNHVEHAIRGWESPRPAARSRKAELRGHRR